MSDPAMQRALLTTIYEDIAAGWSKDVLAADQNGNAIPFWDSRVQAVCLVGALRRANHFLEPERADYLRVCQALDDVAHTACEGRLGEFRPQVVGCGALAYYNMKVVERAEDALALIDKASELSDESS